MDFSLGLDWRETAAVPQEIRLAFGAASKGTWIYMFCPLMAEI
jgi:hypothetical protein